MGDWDALWLAGRVATLAHGGTLRDAAIGIANGRIAWIGPRAALPDRPDRLARDVVDVAARWVTPGLVDCHTHIVFAGDRVDELVQRQRGVDYATVARSGGGILSTVAATRAASHDELVAAALPRALALRAEGVATLEIKSGYGLDLDTERRILQAARCVGERTGQRVVTTFLGAHAVPPEFAGRADDYIDFLCADVLPVLAAEGLIDAVDAFHEDIAFDAAQVERLFGRARDLGLPVKLHADQLGDRGGAALAARHGALSADHLEHADDAGVTALAQAGTVAVLLPAAYYGLGGGRRPPVDALRRHGVPMALATDCNPGSSPTTSLLTVLNMGCRLFGLTPDEAFAGVTRVAAQALGLGAECGTLEVGKRADLVAWDVDDMAELGYWLGRNPARRIAIGGAIA